jgi:hypothetical protein
MTKSSLGSSKRGSNERRSRAPKDFTSLLLSVAATETAIGATGADSAHALEVMHAQVGKRHGKSGTKSQGLFAKHRNGKHVASPETLAMLAKKCPGVGRVLQSPLWSLTRTGLAPPDPKHERFDTLDDVHFWSVHGCMPPASNIRLFSLPLPLTEDVLTRVCSLGSLDAVAILWLVILDAKRVKPDSPDILEIARYLPPTLALLQRTPAGARIANLLFARVRQLLLDDLSSGGRVLALESYDLSEMAQTVVGWSPGVLDPPTRERFLLYREKKGTLPDAAIQWVQQSLTSTQKRRRDVRRGRWGASLGPGAYIARYDKLKPSPSWHVNAIVRLQATLGDYW